MPFTVLFGPLLEVRVYAHSSLCFCTWHSPWAVVLIANTYRKLIMYKAVSRIDSNNPHCNPMTIILSFQMRKLRHREVEWLAQGRMSCQPLADLEGWLMTFEPATGLPFCSLFWG